MAVRKCNLTESVITEKNKVCRASISPIISLIIPVYNEEDSIDVFIAEVIKVLGKEIAYELTFVNDGSTDGTLKKLLSYTGSDLKVTIVNLSRNFGKEAALTAGIDHANGDVVIPIDVDLQDPPVVILEFLEKWKEGYDVVYGIRSCRKSDGILKRIPSQLFYRLFNKFSPTIIPENAGDFRLLDRRVVMALRKLPERNRFMKGLFSWVGFSSTAVYYKRPERAEGSSKWNYWRLFNFAIDGIVGFSTIPMRIWGYIGFVVSAVALIFGLTILCLTLLKGIKLPGYASMMTSILFLGGIQLFSIGVLGEYISRLIAEVKGRPIYIVEDLYGYSETN